MSDHTFRARVIEVVSGIEPGEVWTYGEVAEAAGRPGAARAVGRLLATTDEDLPWWRVVAANGRLVPGHERVHTERLRSEGVKVNPATGRVNLP